MDVASGDLSFEGNRNEGSQEEGKMKVEVSGKIKYGKRKKAIASLAKDLTGRFDRAVETARGGLVSGEQFKTSPILVVTMSVEMEAEIKDRDYGP